MLPVSPARFVFLEEEQNDALKYVIRHVSWFCYHKNRRIGTFSLHLCTSIKTTNLVNQTS